MPSLPSPTLQEAVLVPPGVESRPRNPSLVLGISKADLLGFYKVTSVLLKVLGQRHFTSALHFPLPKDKDSWVLRGAYIVGEWRSHPRYAGIGLFEKKLFVLLPNDYLLG